MSNSMPPEHTVGTRPRPYDFLLPSGRFPAVAICVVVILAAGFVSFILGVNTGDREVQGFKGAIEGLRAGNQRLTADNQDLRAKLVDLQAKLATIQVTLDGLTPSANTYQIKANQALTVADGHLTIGLIGMPSSENVDLNINGKQYSAAAGAVVNITVEPSMNCRVGVMSFDILKSQATVNAACAAAKP